MALHVLSNLRAIAHFGTPSQPTRAIIRFKMLSPRLQLKVSQKQILTPGLVQMVTVLHLNRLELKEMINQELVDNLVLEESLDADEEISPEELQPLLEAERSSDLADKDLLEAADIRIEPDSAELINATNFTDSFSDTGPESGMMPDASGATGAGDAPGTLAAAESPETTEASSTDPFD